MKTSVKSVATQSLEIAFEETGDDCRIPIILLHGFPYDVRQYDAVRDQLAHDNQKIIVPYLRGFGPTRYRKREQIRSGQQAALGKDVIDLLDALSVERAILVGFDWGGRAACVAATLWPERVSGLVSIGGYTIQNIAASIRTPESPEQERRFWYQWYFQTERGKAGLSLNRDELCRMLWKMWSPSWGFAEREFARTAESFRNPDFVETVIHSYRHRYGNSAGDPTLESLERRLAEHPPIEVPTIVLHGADDQVDPPSAAEGQECHFASGYERRILPNVGHCAPAEAPQEVCSAVKSLFK